MEDFLLKQLGVTHWCENFIELMNRYPGTQTTGLPKRLAESTHLTIKSQIFSYKMSPVLESQKVRHFRVRFFVRFLS